VVDRLCRTGGTCREHALLVGTKARLLADKPSEPVAPLADSPKPQETYREQMARQLREADAPFRKHIGICVAVVMVLIFFGLTMAGF
jgi:hypothetical protein